ncbi:MAG: hypothetical protein U9O86_04245 [Campylobacterota bacterium]|nr:hypothetical protein [Campylobacterota bacterium]
MKNILITLLVLIAFNGCGGGGEEEIADENTTSNTFPNSDEEVDTPPTLGDETLRGEWMYIHDGSIVYIDENFEDPITKVDDTLIKINKNGTSYHLMRSGVDTTVVTGNIYNNSSASQSSSLQKSISRSAGRIGNVNMVLKHITDKNNVKKQKLESTGEFVFDDVKSGDYVLSASTEENLSVTADVDIYGEEISLGGFTLVNDDGYNFKTEFIIDNSDSGYFYGSQKTYTGKLKIKNIGAKKGSGLNYTFSTSSPYVLEYTNEIVLGTVDINKTIDIPFTISFNILDKTTVSIPLDIIIKDVNNNEWVDTVFFHVYQTPMNVNIVTKEANVKGYIIAPGHELTAIDTSNVNILIPYRAGKEYYLVLSNPNIDNETPYSVGIDTETLSFENFQNTGAHEPNNQESQAKVIKVTESIVSYLHEGDIDYYKIDMSSDTDVGLFSPPQVPFR